MTAIPAPAPIHDALPVPPDLDPGQPSPEAQAGHVGVDLDHSQVQGATQLSDAVVDLSPPGHLQIDAHSESTRDSLVPAQGLNAVRQHDSGDDYLPPTSDFALPERYPSAASISDPGHCGNGTHPTTAGAGLLALAAGSLDDIERTRIAMGNRLRAMRDDHGLGDRPEYDRAVLIHAALEAAEHQAILELKRALRQHPLGAWVKVTVGIGEKQGARLLAAIDDPYWNHAEDRPRRGPAELWAYCGYAPGQKRQKGVKSNWNAAAKMRARLCAESCIKQSHSPYRVVYDRARAAWADREISDLHKHNHALRLVAKTILRDLWIVGREKS